MPSDSPDDYTALNELKAKPKLREKFSVEDAWVDYEVCHPLFTPGLPYLPNSCFPVLVAKT